MNGLHLLKALSALCCAALLATPAQAVTIDFDDMSPGDAVGTIGDATFSSNIGLDLIVSSVFDTTSGANSLGVDDGGSEVFLPADVVTIDFAAPQRNFSANFITTPFTPLGAFSIVAFAGALQVASTTSIAPSTQTLPDGGEVFGLGLSLPADLAFDQVRLVSAGFGLYSYNIDDIVFSVPEPSTLAVFCVGLILVPVMARRSATLTS